MPSLRYYNPQNNAKNNESDNEMASSEKLESKIAKDDPNRVQRFGLSGYGGGISGYPQSGTGVSSYSPLKIDLGGIVLGTLIGLGAILIIPKLGYLFSGGYRRSKLKETVKLLLHICFNQSFKIAGVENELESITDMLSRFDKTLEEHQIDSSSCMQRVICTYVQDAQKNIVNGQSSTMDEFIQTVTR